MSPIDPNSENWKDGWQTRDAELGLIVQEAVRDELASLGGHLLATYADKVVPDEILSGKAEGTPNERYKHAGHVALATLAGFLLQHYGKAPANPNITPPPPWRGNEQVGYRDPEPPAVGEPPTTTPGGTDEPGT